MFGQARKKPLSPHRQGSQCHRSASAATASGAIRPSSIPGLAYCRCGWAPHESRRQGTSRPCFAPRGQGKGALAEGGVGRVAARSAGCGCRAGFRSSGAVGPWGRHPEARRCRNGPGSDWSAGVASKLDHEGWVATGKQELAGRGRRRQPVGGTRQKRAPTRRLARSARQAGHQSPGSSDGSQLGFGEDRHSGYHQLATRPPTPEPGAKRTSAHIARSDRSSRGPAGHPLWTYQ